MSHDFLSELCFRCIEAAPLSRDPAARQARQTLCDLDQKMEQTMGRRFAEQFREAEFQDSARREEFAFLQGLRFAVNFLLTALPYSSDENSTP